MPKNTKTAKPIRPASSFKFTRSAVLTDAEPPPQIHAKLKDAIKASYGDKNSIQALQAQGYERDADLSNDNQSVYFNRQSGNLLFNIAGTHNVRDIATDFHLAVGNLKGTSRYKEAKDVFAKAKAKYNKSGSDISIVGHSLGGSLASALAEHEKGAKVTTYNKGVGLAGLFGKEKNAAGEKAYRTRGDVVSLLGLGKKGVVNLGGGIKANPLEAHSSDNLAKTDLFVG